MTVIRSKVNQKFTILSHEVQEDKDFDCRYLGAFVRLIGKTEDWDISAEGLSALYPINGPEYYRNALRHMCKLGYLVRIPQPRVQGRYQKVVMELYDSRQIDKPLSDEIVDKLFSNKPLSIEEIKIIYPKRVSQDGLSGVANNPQLKKEELKKEYKASTLPPPKPKPPKEKVSERVGGGSFDFLGMTDNEVMSIQKAMIRHKRTIDDVRECFALMKDRKGVDCPVRYLVSLLKLPKNQRTAVKGCPRLNFAKERLQEVLEGLDRPLDVRVSDEGHDIEVYPVYQGIARPGIRIKKQDYKFEYKFQEAVKEIIGKLKNR